MWLWIVEWYHCFGLWWNQSLIRSFLFPFFSFYLIFKYPSVISETDLFHSITSLYQLVWIVVELFPSYFTFGTFWICFSSSSSLFQYFSLTGCSSVLLFYLSPLFLFIPDILLVVCPWRWSPFELFVEYEYGWINRQEEGVSWNPAHNSPYFLIQKHHLCVCCIW